MRLRTIATMAPISSSACFLRGPRGPLLAWGGDALWVTDLSGRVQPGWPQRGQGSFASSPAAGDVDGDGLPELLCGNDDRCLYGFRLDGTLLPGFPVFTGGDVTSTPALVDLDGDGVLDAVFGSGDGLVYAVRGDGSFVRGWPGRTGDSVAASPCIADLDGDGRPEVIIGSADAKVYAFRYDGSSVPGWPVVLGARVWSSAAAADLDGDGRLEVVVAADQLYALRHDGTPQPGFPQRLAGWTASSPAIHDADGDGVLEIVVGGGALHGFTAGGATLAGFPVDLGGQIWAAPICADLAGTGAPQWLAGSWGGDVHAVDARGTLQAPRIRTAGPVHASAAFAYEHGTAHLAVGSWDYRMYLAKQRASVRPAAPLPGFQGDALRCGRVPPASTRAPAVFAAPPPEPELIRPRGVRMSPDPPVAGRMTYLDVAVEAPAAVRAGEIVYEVDGRKQSAPLVLHRGVLRGMFPALRPGSFCSWHVELRGWDRSLWRIPVAETHSFGV